MNSAVISKSAFDPQHYGLTKAKTPIGELFNWDRSVNTKVSPGDLIPHGSPANTHVPTGALTHYGAPANTKISPRDASHHGPIASTKVTPSDLASPRGGLKRSQDDTHQSLVKQSQNWVSQTFFATLLKQMRNSPFKSEMFSGGQGGQAFASLYDQRLAEHMSRGAGSKLVNSIVRRIEANAAYRKASAAKAAASDNQAARDGNPTARPKSTRKGVGENVPSSGRP